MTTGEKILYFLLFCVMAVVLLVTIKCNDGSQSTLITHQKRVIQQTASTPPYDSLIRVNSDKYRVPYWVINGIIQTESRGQEKATNGKNYGLMGIGGYVIKKYGVKDAFNPAENIRAASNYLSDIYETCRDWDSTLSIYNSGKKGIIISYINKVKSWQH